MELLFKIGFLDIRILDLVDIVLVAILLFNIYKLLKGSLAFNIFIGLLLIYMVWLLVRVLNMQLLAGILGQFIGVGVIALLIVFQPEVRRFLLFLGRGSIFKKDSFWNRILTRNWDFKDRSEDTMNDLMEALDYFARTKTGAIMVFPNTSKLQFFANTGVALDAHISSGLLKSIFVKESPLHDGAVIITGDKILAAGCILPNSENPDLPKHVGMRHRAAVGITENSDATAIVVSEESAQISYSKEGKIWLDVSETELKRILKEVLFNERL